ncbi:MAG: CBS domain-containing protein [Verrucomicrobiae bacterium]|nr:CBS domain-containing protein [Verrucomicrobiae bacterium]
MKIVLAFGSIARALLKAPQYTCGDFSQFRLTQPARDLALNRAHQGGELSVATQVENLLSAGSSDGRKVTLAQLLVYELRVRDAMQKNPVTAQPTDSLRSIQQLMKKHRISGVPITEGDRLVGIVSIEDIINALDRGYINDSCEKWMTRQPVTLRDYYTLVRAVAEFDRHGFGRFPVLDATDRLVGIITRGDISNALVHHLEKRAEQAVANEAVLIAERLQDEKAQRQVLHATIRSGDFESAGRVSQRMRQLLRERGVDPDARRRAAIVAYEAETNIIIHSVGGELRVVVDPDRVVIDAVDRGPGIENLELAMQEGWSTAGPLARQLGFGAGMGLPNMKKNSDRFEVRSELGIGTHVHAEIDLKKAQPQASVHTQ